MVNKNINTYIFISLLVLFLFLQLSLIPQLFFDKAVPNLVLILLLAASFLYKSSGILYIAFLCGFILDIFSGANFGSILLSTIFAVFISSYLGYRFLKELFSLDLILISGVSVLIYNIIHFTLAHLDNFHRLMNSLDWFAIVVIMEIIYATLLIYPLTSLLSYKK
jgi:rod shape-determining protein MreD